MIFLVVILIVVVKTGDCQLLQVRAVIVDCQSDGS